MNDKSSSVNGEGGDSTTPSPKHITRRVFIQTGGALALTAIIPLSGCGGSSPGSGSTQNGGGNSSNGGNAGGDGGDNDDREPDDVVTPTERKRFLADAELATLTAFVDRMIPGQPEDADPGAVTGCCADAIDHMLAAFQSSPPLIYAGAAFSDRGGHPENQFEEFIPLDPYEELAWRIAIEGSQGMAAREFNGPVKGYQEIYQNGLARLNERAAAQGRADFASATAQERDAILGDTSDAVVQELIDIGFPDTLEAMYGAPEYGGNCDLVGWGFTAYDGDVQPRGYIDGQVVNADNPGIFDGTLPASYHDPSQRTAAQSAKTSTAFSSKPQANQPLVLSSDSNAQRLLVAPSPELMSGLIQSADGRLSALRKQLQPLLENSIKLANSSPAASINQPKLNSATNREQHNA